MEGADIFHVVILDEMRNSDFDRNVYLGIETNGLTGGCEGVSFQTETKYWAFRRKMSSNLGIVGRCVIRIPR